MTDKAKEKKEPTRLNQCKTLPELKKFLEQSDKGTSKFDILLIKGGKVSDLVKNFDKVRGDFNDFKIPSRIKAHISYRSKHGWKFQIKDADSDDPYYKLTKIA